MLQTTKPYDSVWTAADLMERFGPIPLTRIRHEPPPGCASEADLRELALRDDRLFELIDGTLVEKTVGTHESLLAVWLITLLNDFVSQHDLGIVLGPDGRQRLAAEQIRLPDVAFYGWHRFPGRQIPATSFLDFAADLAIEVISPGNTQKEMDTKLREYFTAGSQLVWYVYPQPREVHVFVSPENRTIVSGEQSLTGAEVLPGFSLPLTQLFSKLENTK